MSAAPRWVAGALILALLAGLAAEAAARAKPPTVAQVAPALLRRHLRRLTRRVRRLRRLRARRAIAFVVRSKAQALAEARQRFAARNDDQRLAAEELLLKRLGLLPARASYKKLLLGLATGGLGSRYDRATRKLHLAGWLPLATQRSALIHEICHALQDQHFRLGRLLAPRARDRDQLLARHALVEGDCVGVMLADLIAPADLSSIGGALQRLSRAASARLSATLRAAPALLRRRALFPFRGGLRLVQRLRSRYSWRLINRYLRRPPRTTEQVLHPAKLRRRARPWRIRVRPLAALASHRQIHRDVLGELQLAVYLQQGLSRSAAARAAEGWNGDVVVAYRPQQGAAAPLLILLSGWETAADVTEYVNGQLRVFAHWRARPRAAASGNGLWVYRLVDGTEASVQRSRRVVLTIIGAAPALRAALQQQVWRSWRVRGRRLRPPRSG